MHLMMPTPSRALAACFLVLLGAAPAAGQRPLAGFDAYVQNAMRDWHVPGMAIAIVKDDSVVYARGFGVRTVGTAERVDEHTSFAIASTTKAFTATALAMLVDEGKLRWDDPVSLHLPGLRLFDPELTGQLTVRDLLSHRTGLPGSDALWYASPHSSDEIVRRLRFVRPFAAPRTRYQYNNIGYMVAGMVVQQASGMPWSEFVRTRILQPLEMRETLTGYRGLDARGNVATPHVQVNDTVMPVPYLDFDNIGPAGSMNSSVSDMALWIRFQLDSGRVGGRRLVSAASHREMLTPQFLVPAASFYPEPTRLSRPTFTAYGLGWFLQDYRGRKLAMHTGSIDGMTAILALVPEERLGLVIYANLDHAEVRHALMYRIVDEFLGGPRRDWSAELRPAYAQAAERGRAAERERRSHRAAGTRPSLPPHAYAGTYVDPDSVQSSVVLRYQDGVLVADLAGRNTAPLEHWHHDVFLARWANRAMGESFIAFTIDERGRAGRMRMGVNERVRVADPPAAPAP
jgi:CubicO group peptidase (beta-lactamase class C family)